MSHKNQAGKMISFPYSLLFFSTLKMSAPVPIFVLMGTAGCGKSSVAEELQKLLGCEYLEGDSLHPPSNVEKMASGKIYSKQPLLF